MKPAPILCLCLFPGGPLSAPAAEAPAPRPAGGREAPPAHAGRRPWKPIAAVMGGVRVPEAARQAITLKIMGDQCEVTVTGEAEPDRGSCVLDLTTTSGPNKGKTSPPSTQEKRAVPSGIPAGMRGFCWGDVPGISLRPIPG